MGKNRLLSTAWVLLILALVSTRWVGGLYARYTTEGSGGGSARVAAFVFVTQGKDGRALDLSNIQKPGDSQSYVFTVSNQNGSAVSEVAEEVKFTVRLNGSMPLKCTISNEEEAEVMSVIFPQDARTLPVERTGTARELPAAAATTHTYTMTVEWPAEANESIYASRSAVAEVLLTVTAEQID